jgi:hypothetical protein
MHRRLAAVVLLLLSAGCATQRVDTSKSTKVAPEVNLLTMGDWGRGNALQKTVATSMSTYVTASTPRIDGLLCAGDNFYVPLTSIDDLNWRKVFEEMYDARTLNFPFYVALGNHDYEVAPGVTKSKAVIEKEYAAAHPESRWKLPADWYRVDFPSTGRPLVSVLMLNSNKVKLSEAEWQEELVFIDRELADRRGAKWMLAVAHHPLFSNGAHGDIGPLQSDWGPLFRKHKLDFYIAGHDHDLQHLEIPDYPVTSFVLAGGGGATTRPMLRDNRGPFSQARVGFVHLKLTPALATITYLSGQDASPIHQFTRTPGGQTAVTLKGEVDPAASKKLQIIQGLDQKKKKADDGD